MTRLLRAPTLAAALLCLLAVVAYAGEEGERTPAAGVTAASMSAQAGAIEMGIDPETTGNTCAASPTNCNLGTVESCVRVDVDPADFGDGVADHYIDVVIDDPAASAPAPTLYDAWVYYDAWSPALATTLAVAASIADTTITVTDATGFSIGDKIVIGPPGREGKSITGISGNDIDLDSGLGSPHGIGEPVTKLFVLPVSIDDKNLRIPGADIGGSETIPEPSPDGLLTTGWMFLTATPVPGTNTYIGDGPVVRIGLDIQAAGLATFSFYETASTYNSIATSGWPDYWHHSLTFKGGLVAINQDCPALPPTSSPTPTSTPVPGTPTPLPTPPPGTILLLSGWNNTCHVGPEQPIEDALAGIAAQVVAVYRMKADQGFDRWFPNRPGASTITAVSPYQPLLILMSQYGFWPHEPSGTPSASVPLAPGWNSVCYTGQTKSAEDATAGVAGGFVIMYRFDGGQGWSRYVPARPEVSNIVQLSRYDTVLMLVSQEGGTSWTFDP